MSGTFTDGVASELALHALGLGRRERLTHWEQLWHRVETRETPDRQEDFTTIPTGNDPGPRRCEPGGLRIFNLRNELVAVPGGWDHGLSVASLVELRFEDALGGDAGVARRMIADLEAFARGGGRCQAYGKGLIASGHAEVFVTMPGVRILHPQAQLMIHSGMRAVIGNPRRLRAVAEALERDNEAVAVRIAKRTGAPLRVVRGLFDGQDHYLGASLAFEFGFCNRVEDIEAAQPYRGPKVPQPGPPVRGGVKAVENGRFENLVTGKGFKVDW